MGLCRSMTGATLAFVATLSAAKSDDGDYQDASYHHAIRAGQSLQIANARSWGPPPDCRSTGARVVLTLRPAHGFLKTDRVMTTVPAERENCAGHPVATTRMFYTPAPDYQGPERIAYDEVVGNGGRTRHVEEDLDVLPRLIKVHEGQVFRTVPPPGSLDAPQGMTLYVDDRSCPNGQIKRLVTGRMQPPVPRSFDCVQR